MKAVVDRIVQYMNRYQLTNVETGEVLGTFDFDEVTGTVQQVGTEIDKELFDSIATDLAARVKLSGGELAETIVTFPDISGTAENVASSDTSATLWGKVKNWFSRLKALAFKNKVAAGDFEAGAIKNADVAADAAIAQSKVSGLMTDYVASISVSGRTVTYKNKNGANMGSITTQDTTYGLASPLGNGLMSATDKTKLDGIERGAQKNTVLGVKGGSESAYRTGNVNITKANIGLGNVDNTSDQDKPVSTATKTALNGKANTSGTYPNLTVGKATNATNATNAETAIAVPATLVPNNADLNDYRGENYWGKTFYAGGNNSVQNLPYSYSAGFSLEALKSGSNSTIQRLFAMTSEGNNIPTIYTRSVTDVVTGDGTWSEWQEVAEANGTYPEMTVGKATADEDGNNIKETYATKAEAGGVSPNGSYPNMTVGKATNATVHSTTLIPGNTDINTYRGENYWGKTYYAGGANTVQNIPVAGAGFSLEVFRSGSASTTQRITTMAAGSNNQPTVYTRSVVDSTTTSADGTWTAWTEVAEANGTYPEMTVGNATNATNITPDENGAVNPLGRKDGGVVGNLSTALGNNTTASGESSIALGREATASDTYSIALGYGSNATSNYSMALGREATASGASSTALGSKARATGGISIALGLDSIASAPHSTALGCNAVVPSADSRTMQLGSQDGTTSLSVLRCKVNLTVTSDKRDKTDIEGITDALAFLERLNPVTFVSNDRVNYISDEDKKGETFRTYGMCDYDRIAHAAGTKKGERRRCGLLAQEVIAAMQEVYGTDNYANVVNDNFHDLAQKPSDVENKYTLAYANLVPFLIGAIKELNAKIKDLESKPVTST